jgi:hypothetical protein
MASTPGNPAVPLAAACCLVGGAAYVAAVDPSGGGVFPPCPFRAATGWWCPGCGLTRATHHLLQGDIVTAVRYNALVPVVLALVAGTWLVWMLQASGRPVAWRGRAPQAAWVVAVVLALAFAIVRNLPGTRGLRG